MNRINLLPKWVLPDSIPSVYDCESGSWMEMAAKVYGAARELQDDYNVFAGEINKAVNDYIESDKKDQEAFKEEIIKIVHDYIRMIERRPIFFLKAATRILKMLHAAYILHALTIGCFIQRDVLFF